jgi:1-pyrroline-5-carboxylate dehydrogenase
MKMGSPEDMSNFITAVISEGSFDKLKAIDQAKRHRCRSNYGWKL